MALGFISVFFDTSIDISDRAAILILLLILSVGLVLVPDGLPDVIWIGILALIWTTVSSKLAVTMVARRQQDTES